MAEQLKSYDFGMPWETGYGFTQAIQAGPTLYVSGQLSHDMEARSRPPADGEAWTGIDGRTRRKVVNETGRVATPDGTGAGRPLLGSVWSR